MFSQWLRGWGIRDLGFPEKPGTRELTTVPGVLESEREPLDRSSSLGINGVETRI